MASHDWGELSPGMKRMYAAEGVTAGTYNRWWRMDQSDRTQLTVRAKANGYDSGLKFMAAQAQVRRSTGKTITPATSPREAARQIIRGKRGTEGKRQRNLVSKLFDLSLAEHEVWVEFMSP